MTPGPLADLHLAALWSRFGGGSRAVAATGEWARGLARGPRVPADAVPAGLVGAPARDAEQALGPTWQSLTPRERAAVADPVRRMAAAGRQHDSTTCGPSVLVMLAATGDPALALWLATGRFLGAPGAVRPPELVGAPRDRLERLATAAPAARFAVLQRVVKARATGRAVLGVAPWPGRFGTPPWAAAAAARFPGVAYGHTPVDDRDEAATARLLETVRSAVAVGVPVPLYTGGDVGRGWATALPRHLVLAVGAGREDALEVWEPGAGRVLHVPHEVLLHGGRHPGLGGWSRWVWTLLPRLADGTPEGDDGQDGPSPRRDRA